MQITKILSAFERKGYAAHFFKTGDDARSYLRESLVGRRIGFGGSVTLEALGLFETLSEKNRVFWHWRCPEGMCASEVLEKAAQCPIYFSSANALTEDGKIVNIDGTANRVSSLLYGHEKVYFVCGKNKLCKNEEEALFRARNVAAPANAVRLGKNTPCVKTGHCHDCSSPERICRTLSVLWEKPGGTELELILIDECLGY